MYIGFVRWRLFVVVVCCLLLFKSSFLGQMKSDWADFGICYSSNKTLHKIQSYQKSAYWFGGTMGQKLIGIDFLRFFSTKMPITLSFLY